MRALGLGVCALAALFSLRPVSDLFREPERAAVANAFIEAPGNPPPKAVQAFAQHIGGTNAVPFTAGFGIRSRDAGQHRASAASLSDSEEGRILAIKKELKRLGLYDGPMTRVWGEDARKAARKFTGVKSKPSPRLLADLRAANAAPARNNDSRREQAKNREGLRKIAKAQGAPRAALVEGALSEGYLPPSHMLQTAQERSSDRGAAAIKSARGFRGKREAAIRLANAKHPSRSSQRRRRSILANASFSWPGF